MEKHWMNKLSDMQVPAWPNLLVNNGAPLQTHEIPVPPAVMDELTAIAGGDELNMLKLLLGGLSILLWKYTGVERTAISLPPLLLPGEEGQQLYLLMELDGDLLIPALLEQVHEALNEAGENGTAHIGMSYEGLTGEWLQEPHLHFHFNAGSSILTVSAKELLFPDGMLQNMAAGLLHLVAGFSINKELTIASCNITSAAMLEEWRQQFAVRKRAYPYHETVLDLFNKQVIANPQKAAVSAGGTMLSYQQLDEWSAQIATYILAQGYSVRPLFIGIVMERSAALIATVLGILRSGAAYVPMDPDYPAERLKNIIEDTNCPLIITDKYDFAVGKVVNIHDIPRVATTAALPRVLPEDLAYVIYSSGTTGKPKGIMIQHLAVMNLLYWYNERYEINADTRIAQMTNIVVDIAFQEIFSSLINGSTLNVPLQEVHQDKNLFLDWMQQHAISFIQLIPDMLEAYFQDEPKLPSLHRILVGGDKLSEVLKDDIVSKGYQLFNIYGQTETAIDTVGAECRVGEDMSFNDYVPNYEVYILDNAGNLCPEYVAGEICTGGIGLAPGYLGNPVLTAEKFVTDPFTSSGRLYKTGDRGKRMPDGSIRLLGRADEQVKIRGYRVELEEVEVVLKQYPSVDNAVVVVKADEGEEKQLLAFITGNENIDLAACKTFLKDRLPDYMVPVHFIRLDHFPLTNIGKVDRKQLRKYTVSVSADAGNYIAPRNETERQLVGIWQQLTGREKISVTDNFFDLGGHSLKITRLGSQIKKSFGVTIDIRSLFIHAVLEEQALLIANGRKALVTAIPVLEPQESYVLSSAQQSLWSLCQLDAGNAAYNIPGVFVFEGRLDKTALHAAFNTVITKYESLRTIFSDARQIILPPSQLNFHLNEADLRQAPSTVQAFVLKDLSEPFDLAQWPLLRGGLYQIADEKWVFSFVMHHIISDDWSLGIFFNDLLKYYHHPVFSPLRIQYKDYAAWQRGQLETVGDRQYWMNLFQDDIPVLELPVDKARPAVKTFRGSLIKHSFNETDSLQLLQLLRNNDSTLFMGLLACVSTLMYRYTGQEDMVIGSPVAGRNHGDLEDQIGYFVNMLALRIRLSGNDNFTQLLSGIKALTLEAYNHQDYPFDMLVKDLGIAHDPGRNPLFDVVVGLQNAAGEIINGALPDGLNILPFDTGVGRTTSKFDLIFNFQESATGLHLALEYNTDIFENDTMLRMLQHLNGLINAIVNNGQLALNSLPYMDAAEKDILIRQYNDTDANYPYDATINSLFSDQAAQIPEFTAVVCDGERLSYSELDVLANRFAQYLRSRHEVESEDLVCVKLDRGVYQIAVLLGILKAGAGYVPMDPAYPVSRIDYILSDSGSRLIVDDAVLSDFLALMVEYSTAAPAVIIHPDQVAYVIYTSGTTGQPKGVQISHRNVVRLLYNERSHFSFGTSDVWTMFHSYCFDFSVWEMYGALLFGGRLVIVPLMVSRDPAAFLSLCYAEGVTVLNQTPSAFYNLIAAEEERGEWGLGLRYVIFGGEALSPGRLGLWSAHYPATDLINMYGITETTVHVTYKKIGEHEIVHNISNIGIPLPTLRTYVLDAAQEVVPVGIWGELYVGGAGVAKGYLNREELTQTKFLSSQFIAGDRLYRSGDRVRWLANGEMEYGGRLDEQVKIRGFRIELGEIISALEAHPAVERAVVSVYAGRGGQKELVGYVTGTSAPDREALRSWLTARLPEYMVPATFVHIAEIPLTVNGKVDRKKLPAPEVTSAVHYAMPENEMQQKLSDIWGDVLGNNNIGIHDNFFSIGGNSISVISLISKARQQNIAISVRLVFENPTVATLASVAVWKEQLAENREIISGEMPLMPIHRWYFDHQTIDAHHFNYAKMMVAPEGLDEGTFRKLVKELVRKHDALRLRFDDLGYFIPFDDQLIANIAVAAPYSEAHASAMQQSLSIQDGPLVRIVHYENRLLLIVHHLVVDGVSWRILLEDMERLFQQFRSGKPFDLGGKTSSYKEWAEKLAAYSSDKQLLNEKAYWEGVLQKATTTPFAQRERTIGGQRKVSVILDEKDTDLLLHKAGHAYNNTINDLLLTALMYAFNSWNKADKLLIHLEGHGREDLFPGVDLSHTVGWFTTIYPVVLNLSDDIGASLMQTKEELRSIPQKGIGYGLLRHLIQDEKTAGILFNYLGDFSQLKVAAADIREKTGPTVSDKQRALYALEFNSAVLANQLQFSILYQEDEFEAVAMEELGAQLKGALQSVIRHCIQAEKTQFTPSDFPLAGISQEKIIELEADYPDLEQVYPATAMQQAMFFYSMTADDSTAYVVQQHGQLNNIDPETFRQSWELLIQRHAVLRTGFALCEKNGLLQVISRQTPLNVTYLDGRQIASHAWEHYLNDIVEQDAALGFEFEQAPLFRYTLVQRDAHEYCILLTLHHIILDGWSMPLLFSELNQVYAQLSTKTPVQLAPAPHYGKYMEWLFTRNGEPAREFWQKVKFGEEAISQLALLAHAAPEIPATGYREIHRSFTFEESQQLIQSAANNNITLHTLLVAAWARLLNDYTRSNEVVFGMTVSGRSETFEGIGSIVGLLINSIPVKVVSPAGEPITQWLAALHAAQMEYNQHGTISLNEIRRINGIKQHIPLFESLLVHQNYPNLNQQSKSDAPSLSFKNAGFRDNNNNPLTIMIFSNQSVSFLINYRQEMFAEGFVERIADDFKSILADLAFEASITLDNLKKTC